MNATRNPMNQNRDDLKIAAKQKIQSKETLINAFYTFLENPTIAKLPELMKLAIVYHDDSMILSIKTRMHGSQI